MGFLYERRRLILGESVTYYWNEVPHMVGTLSQLINRFLSVFPLTHICKPSHVHDLDTFPSSCSPSSSHKPLLHIHSYIRKPSTLKVQDVDSGIGRSTIISDLTSSTYIGTLDFVSKRDKVVDILLFVLL